MFGQLIEKSSEGKYKAESAMEILNDRSTLTKRIPQIAQMMKGNDFWLSNYLLMMIVV